MPPTALAQRVAALEQRVAALEAHLATVMEQQSVRLSVPTRLVTPVEVSTPEGHVILTIHQHPHHCALSLHNDVGQVVATMGVDGIQAGFVSLRNAAGSLVAVLDVEAAGARLRLHNHAEQGGVVLFGGDSGADAGGGIHVLDTAGNVGIALWSQHAGGQITLYTDDQEILHLPAPESQPS